MSALYDFVASRDDDLALGQGDLVTVLSTDADGWSYGYHWDTGRRGHFPSSYVQPATDNDVRAWQDRQRQAAGQAAERAAQRQRWEATAASLQCKEPKLLSVCPAQCNGPRPAQLRDADGSTAPMPA